MIKILSIVVSCASIFLLSSCGGGSTGATGATGPAGSVSTAASATPNVLHSFQGGISDGSYPSGSLIQGSDGFFYGTSSSGGSNNSGTVFKVSTAGVVTVIYSFSGNNYSNSGVIQGSDGYLYGTNYAGGANSSGSVFKLSTTGTFTTLYSFTYGSSEGAYPYGNLIQASDGYLYGTTGSGGANNYGTVYKISTTGTFTNLYSFAGGISDGCNPYQGLKQGSDGYLYGLTSSCGAYSQGVIFKISTAGVESILHAFAGGLDGSSGYYQGGSTLVIAADGNLYGVNASGGLYGSGTVYKITTSGTFSTLYSFGNSGIGNPLTIIQGVDGNLYGSTSTGSYYSNGNANYYYNSTVGTIFKISTTGTYTSLYSFQYGLNGTSASGMIQASDGRFYGLAQGGGMYGIGTMFQF